MEQLVIWILSPSVPPSVAGPDVAMVDDLITDIVLGPAVSKDSVALEIVAPGGEAPVQRQRWRSWV